jgi:hypothetical protein
MPPSELRTAHLRPDIQNVATPRPAFEVRIAEIAALRPDGSKVFGQRRVPTLPVFDQALAAYAQGTVFKAKDGYIAAEDLQPGDWLMSTNGDPEQVAWIGSSVFSATAQQNGVSLTRVMADAFGVNRPESFTTLGPAARLLQTPPDLRSSTFSERLMSPVTRFLDGVNVIEITPPTPQRLFHVCMKRHVALIANGLPVESYHPGPTPVSHLPQSLQAAFLTLFPHVTSLSDFGPMRYAHAPEPEERGFMERA